MAQSAGEALWGTLSRGIEVRSAGLAAAEGASASASAREVVRKRGGDLEGHQGHQITAEDLDWADLVLTMTRAHRDALRGLRRSEVEILTLAEFSGSAETDIADPFGGTAHDYEAAYEEIEQYIRAGTSALERWARP